MTGPRADLVFSGERQEETRPFLRALGVYDWLAKQLAMF